MPLSTPPEVTAERLFGPIASDYDRWSQILGLGRYLYWRRRLVEWTGAGAASIVLDVATGTGGVAAELARASDCRVVGLDQSRSMLLAARSRQLSAIASAKVHLVRATAASLPFADGSFDVVVHTFLLRYASNPIAMLDEMVRVLRPGGVMVGLEFAVPKWPWRLAWDLYVGLGLPVAGLLAGPGWFSVGRFLKRSIEGFYRLHPLPVQLSWWSDAGIDQVETMTMSLGGAVLIKGVRRGG